MKYVVPTLMLILVLAVPSQAQIINIESKRGNLQDTSGLFGFLDLGFNLTSNTKTIINTRASLRLEWLKGKHRLLLLGNYNLVSVNDDRFINNSFGHLRHGYELRKWLRWESFGQIQENELLRISFRGLLGTGPRFRVFIREKQQVYLGTLYMFEYNEVSDTAFIQRDSRLSTYLSLALQPSPTLSISNTTYAQPVITNPGDIRLSSITRLSLKISSRLSYTLTFNITYDSRLSSEAEGVPSTVYSFINGLRWNF